MYNNPYIMYQQRSPQTGLQNGTQIEPQMFQQIQQPVQPIMQPIVQNTQPTLLGKQVESIEVVRATEVPFDGSISYFPLSDSSAIITKKIQADGTSKMVVYKPVVETEKEQVNYVTIDQLQDAIKGIDLSEIGDLKNDIKDFDKRLKELENSKRR